MSFKSPHVVKYATLALIPLVFFTPTLAQLPESSIPELKRKAETGDPVAQYQLGRAYVNGAGVPQSDPEAVAWYRKAADQGYADAENSLGVMYFNGRGVEEDWAEAVRWYHQAARQKNASAMFNLGAAYYNGDRHGSGIDDAAAYAWFKLAEENGSAAAKDAVARSEKELSLLQQNMGLRHIAAMYTKGDEVPRNPHEAERWMRIVAQRGDTGAQVQLAAMLSQEQPPEYSEAFHWHRHGEESRRSAQSLSASGRSREHAVIARRG